MEFLIALYLVSFIMVIVLMLIEATQKYYSNQEFVIGFVMSLVPLFNTVLAISGLFEVTPKIKWMRKPFFIQPKNRNDFQ